MPLVRPRSNTDSVKGCLVQFEIRISGSTRNPQEDDLRSDEGSIVWLTCLSWVDCVGTIDEDHSSFGNTTVSWHGRRYARFGDQMYQYHVLSLESLVEDVPDSFFERRPKTVFRRRKA